MGLRQEIRILTIINKNVLISTNGFFCNLLDSNSLVKNPIGRLKTWKKHASQKVELEVYIEKQDDTSKLKDEHLIVLKQKILCCMKYMKKNRKTRTKNRDKKKKIKLKEKLTITLIFRIKNLKTQNMEEKYIQ
ncbi:hypothetical protein BpHYR1_036611 [Brachionus plicatilis]|uniref:Uncharacterized protein n=1 Tax=Brachionus plicatilis TaxID=10195 RepID=A0A3M7SQS8_BRAPC|nr:hypothetical protein BpHYR1_036611 [Brachionus plicatilis]